MSKIELQDFVYIGKLLQIYGQMLSADRQAIMKSYFEFNMTLAEIAQERNISRQAVLDAIDKSCEKLKSYENVLQINSKNEELNQTLLEIKKIAEGREEEEIVLKVDKILRKL